jgi:REP element-mobilizing transposase RayT
MKSSVTNTFTKIPLHVVFAVRFRKPLIKPEFAEKLYAHIGQTIKNKGMIPLTVGGYLDHVHILFFYKPSIPLPELVKIIKTSTTFMITREHWCEEVFRWQRGYGAFAVCQEHIDRVSSYIRNQTQHHERRSFADEYKEFMKHHQLDYEEGYLLDPEF